MVNKNKTKGTTFENELVEIFNRELNGNFKRIPLSGAIGTTLGESLLTGDVTGKVEGIAKRFKIECKARSGGTQISVKKEWLDKIKEEAEANFSIPLLACKFIGARSGVKKFIAMDIETFVELINMLTEECNNG